jgi:hypothetical protein
MIGTPAINGRGRLMLKRDNAWGAICNLGFDKASALVACKQMGYDSGDILGGPGVFKGCQ